MRWRAALAAVALSAAAASAAPPLAVTPPALSDDDVRRVDRGDTVVLRRPVDGFPWPEVVAYRRTTAPPAAVMAVYADFGAHASWVPELVESRVLAREDANIFRVAYEYEVAGPNERYTVTIRLTREGDVWQARWTLVTARYARRLEGSLRARPRGDGTLVVYTTLVDPGALGATFGTPGSVAKRLVGTTEALTERAERLLTSEPHRVADLVARLGALVGVR